MAKQQKILIIVFFSFLLGAICLAPPYSYVLVPLSAVLFFSYAILLFYKDAIRTIDGDFIFRRQKIRVSMIFFVISALTPVTAFLFAGKFNFIPLVLSLTGLIAVIIITRLAKRLKPVGFVVAGDKLIVNKPGGISRNLNNLNGVKLNGLTEELILSFNQENRLVIQRDEYLPEDIERFVSICIEKSNGNLIVSDNLKQ